MIWRIALLLLLSFPAHADLSACVADADRLREKGAIGPTQRAERVRDCNNAAHGRNQATDEYWAYYVYMASEYESGRVSREQALYLIQRKQSEIGERQAAAMAPLLPYAVTPKVAPRCSFYPPGIQGYAAARGECW